MLSDEQIEALRPFRNVVKDWSHLDDDRPIAGAFTIGQVRKLVSALSQSTEREERDVGRRCSFTGGQCLRASCRREDECRAEAVIAEGNALVRSWRDKAIAHGYTDQYVEPLPASLPMEASREMVDAACAALGYPGGDRSLYARAWKVMAQNAAGVLGTSNDQPKEN